jgi:hypothetical protein
MNKTCEQCNRECCCQKCMSDKDKHQSIRRQFWMDVWIACASSSNCVNKSIACDWADRALSDLDSRFGAGDK